MDWRNEDLTKASYYLPKTNEVTQWGPFWRAGYGVGCTLTSNPAFMPNYFGLPGIYKSQDTITLGVLVFFGPARL